MINSRYKDLHLYEKIYSTTNNYGNTGHRYADIVYKFILETNPLSVLDFGCGQGSLKKNLATKNIDIDEYDPCIPGKNTINKLQYDLIVTTDVLEHIYENEINTFFSDIMSLAPKYMIHIICTRPAEKVLPDGTNAHKTIKNKNWWKEKIFECSNFNTVIIDPHEYKDFFIDKNTCVIKAKNVYS